MGGHILSSTRSIINSLARHIQTELGQGVLALGQRLGVADHARQVVLPHPRHGQKAVVHRQLHLPNDVEPVSEKEVVVPVDRTAQGVFHRQHRPVRDPQLHRLERHLELVARDGLAPWVRFSGCGFRIRAGDALVRHAQLRPVHWRRAEVARERLRKLLDWEQIQGFAPVDGGDSIAGAATGGVSSGDGVLLGDDDLAGENSARALPVGAAGTNDAVLGVDATDGELTRGGDSVGVRRWSELNREEASPESGVWCGWWRRQRLHLHFLLPL